jgi:serine/threonine protein kinase
MNAPSESGTGWCRHCGSSFEEPVISDVCPSCLILPASKLVAPLSAEELDDVLPNHDIREKLGEGANGCVFKVYNQDLEREEAVKTMRESAVFPDFARRFEFECKAMARLRHPNIPVIFDHGAHGKIHYFTMDFMPDGSLESQLIHAEIPLERAFEILRQVCAALSFAHDKNVIHRDVKPSNVLLAGSGIRLADFGLAKRIYSSEPGITQVETRLGTPGYMAPEQVIGQAAIDHRADIFSLGVLLYRLLTGTVPQGGYLPLPSECGNSGSFDRIIKRALAMNPNDRHQTVDEFRNELEEAAFAALPEA